MNISYIKSCEAVNWEEVSQIIKSVEWGTRSPEQLQAAFSRSSFVRFAYDGEKLVGMGRTVDDGAFYAWIVDLVVIADYQGQGIGSRILKELELDLTPYVTTMLTAAPGKSGFYEKSGWVIQTSAFIRPRSEWQKRAFTEKE